MGGRKKWILNISVLLILFSMIVYYVFHEQNPKELLHLLDVANGWYWIGGIVLVFLFVSCESAILRLLLSSVGVRPKKGHCLLYSFIGFFFSAITPAAGGGQPAQVFYMHKDGLDPGITSPILVVVTIGYKLVLVIYGLAALVLRPKEIFDANDLALWWGAAGLVLNLLAISVFMLAIFTPELVESILHFLVKGIRRVIRSKRLERMEEKLEKSIEKYKEVTGCIKGHPLRMLVVLLISIFQRSLLFAVTWLVLYSFGITGYSLPLIILMQSMVSLGTDLLPLPGGSGANEAFFLLLFEGICGENLVLPVMVASRGISFYAQLMICGIFACIGIHLIGRKNKKMVGQTI